MSGGTFTITNVGVFGVDTGTPMGSMVFMVLAVLAEMELAIKPERITDSVSQRRAAGKDLDGRQRLTSSERDCRGVGRFSGLFGQLKDRYGQ
jgi:DNA invertase Pin-like site-specific DNA recombinase